MTNSQSINQLLLQFNVPAQDLAQLSFCDGNREASIKAWVRSLPLTQIQFVSGLLYQALPDIGRFKTTPGNRISLLEILRNPTNQAIQGLAQSFLNQPLILPEAAVKTATIAQALQKHLINGYLVAVRDLCSQTVLDKELLSLALHRAISGIGMLLLRNYQLYVPISGHLWTELHTLYQIAQELELSEMLVVDELPHHQHCPTITLAYIRTLLLACARPNQLRQDEILATYEALDELTHFAQLQSTVETGHNNLFAVALNSNRPPMYRSRFKAQGHKLLLEINTAQLCKALQDVNGSAIEGVENTGWRNELHLTSALTTHLIQAWNVLAQRHFERQQTSGHLDVTVGLTNIHFHVAGGMSFTHFLNKTHSSQALESGNSIFQKRGVKLKDAAKQKAEEDPWGDAFDVTGARMENLNVSTGNIEFAIRQQEGQEYKDQHPVYKVPLIDSSPGGYCIEWRDEIPNQVKAGELLGLRDPARNRWSVGVVRWANQTKGATQLGIQILAPNVKPVGIAIIHKTGASSEYLRALEIPMMKAINQPITLITNAISFREYSKAKIYRRADKENDADQSIQLTRRLFATGAFSQFTYRELSTGKPKDKEKPDDFNAVWDS